MEGGCISILQYVNLTFITHELVYLPLSNQRFFTLNLNYVELYFQSIFCFLVFYNVTYSIDVNESICSQLTRSLFPIPNIFA